MFDLEDFLLFSVGLAPAYSASLHGQNLGPRMKNFREGNTLAYFVRIKKSVIKLKLVWALTLLIKYLI